MNNKQKRRLAGLGYKQEPLSMDFDRMPNTTKTRQRLPFYYIVRKCQQQMLVSIDPHGNPIWTVHDLRTVKPQLYNNIHNANRDRWEHGGGNVLLYPYSN